LATTFWTSSNFHLWMLCFVLPTTAIASISGYRRHKNKGVAAFTIAGVALLVAATLWERASLPESSNDVAHTFESSPIIYSWANQQPPVVAVESESSLAAGESCGSCCVAPLQGNEAPSLSLAGITLSTPILLNLLGGLLLIGGHWRNFRLCRNGHSCTH
jgi:hypothetical protein